MNGVPGFPCFPSQEEIDERMRVLNEAVRQLEATQESGVKAQAEKSLKEVYNWLVIYRINFYFDRETDAFCVIGDL